MTPSPDFKLILERNHASLLVLSPELRIVAASDPYLRDTMTVREEILGHEMFDVFPDDPDDPDATGVAALRASLERVLSDGRPDAMAVQKYDVRRPDSEGGGFEERYWSPVNSPILDDAGRVLFIVHQVRDVTDFVRLQMADDAKRRNTDDRIAEVEQEIFLRAQEIQQTNTRLRASEERFRLLSRTTSDALWEWDLATGQLWISESFEDLVGYRPEDIPSVDAWRELVHPDDRPWVTSRHKEAISSGDEGWTLEYRLVHRTGRVVWAESRSTIIRDASRRAVRIVGGTTDLTERKEAELEIRRQAEFLDQASDAIMVRDLEDRITFWNVGAERMFGWSRAEALGHHEPAFRRHDPDTFATAKATTAQAGEWFGELRLHAKDGREIVAEARWTLLRDTSGQPAGVLFINTDVTERRRLESHYLRAQRLESIGTLAGGIAHDLNNVLTPILMATELLRNEVESTQAREWLDLLESSARRGAAMVDQVLTFARGVEGRRESLDVVELAEDVVRLISDSFPKSIRITSDWIDGHHVVMGDSTQLHQVLLNLCVNARDAMPVGGELSIHVGAVSIDEQYAAMTLDAQPGDYVVVNVADSGVGIAPADMERIFDPFFTTKGIGQGTGLGLATSHAITRSHGGFMNAYSEPGRGSTFNLYLPATSNDTSAARPPVPIVHRANPGETILVVEDEPPVMLVTRHTLEGAGYGVVTATDGAEGIATYTMRRDEIDLVLTDMMMPIMDGAALTAALLRVDPGVRVVITSGLARAQRGVGAAAIDTDHFLPKPYTAEALLAAVRFGLDAPPSRASARDAHGGDLGGTA